MQDGKVGRIAAWIALGVVAAVIGGIVLGIVVRELWNWLMPGIFGLPEITYWQAVGLFILAHLLIGGMPGGTVQKTKGR